MVAVPSGRIIVLKGDPVRKEAKAAAAGILPGHRLALTLNGAVLEVGVAGVATEDDPGRKAFATENDVVGNTAADVYADNDDVQYVVGRPGDEIMVRATASLTWVTGAALYAAAAGRIGDDALATGVATAPIGYALSNVTSSSADDLVPMEVA